jgi:hypothetical protein
LDQIPRIPSGEVVKKWKPGIRTPTPDGPCCCDLVLDLGRQIPEGEASGRGKDRIATSRRHRAGDACLRKKVGFRKPSGQGGLPGGSEYAPGIPPSGTVHLTKPGDGKAEFQQVGRFDFHDASRRLFLMIQCGGMQSNPTGIVDEFESGGRAYGKIRDGEWPDECRNAVWTMFWVLSHRAAIDFSDQHIPRKINLVWWQQRRRRFFMDQRTRMSRSSALS